MAAEAEFVGTKRFSIKRRLGAGAMGVVYEAFDRERDVPVALKVLRQVTADGILYFKHEFRALQDIQHPNLVNLGELFEAEGQWFFTMDLVDGVSLLSYVRGGDTRRTPVTGPPDGDLQDVQPTVSPQADLSPCTDAVTSKVSMTDSAPPALSPAPVREHALLPREYDEARLRRVLRQLASGIHALHCADKIHRDIKPSNILVTRDGQVVILDFGVIAELVDGRPRTDIGVAGTVSYMAPEQATGKGVGPASDWYSVGVVLYAALTGRLPFVGEERDVLEQKQRRTPARPSTIVAGVPKDLDLLCTQLLSPTPLGRPVGEELLARVGSAVPTDSGAFSAVQDLGTSVPFVGRQAELDFLHTAFDESRQGQTVIAFVYGESGVGKSALVERFLDEVGSKAEDPLVLTGRCYERESVPFKAVDGLIDDLSRYLIKLPQVDATALLPRWAALLGRLFPVLRRVEAIAEAPTARHQVSDPQELRRRMFRALRGLLARLSDRTPLVLVVDDFQWTDNDSLSLLAEITHPPEAPPLLLLATVRSESRRIHEQEREYKPVWKRLAGDVRNLDLGTLPLDAATQLAHLLLTQRGELNTQDTGHAEAIAREAGGHPLFIQELVRHLVARPSAAARSEPRQAESRHLEEAIWSRIGQLEERSLRLVEVLAVAEVPISQEALARAAQLSYDEYSGTIAGLRVAHLARTSGARRRDTVELYHGAIRPAVLAHLNDARQQHHHGRLVRALKQTGADTRDPQILIRHLEAAGQGQEAAEQALQAAEIADRTLAFDQAASLFRTALRLGQYDDDVRRQHQIKLASALSNAGRGAEASEAFSEAAVGADPFVELDCRHRAAELLLRSGKYNEGLEALSGVLSSVGLRYPARPWRALVGLVYRRARLGLRGIRFKRRDQREISPQKLTQIDVCWSAAGGLSPLDPIRGADYQTRHLLMALKAGEPRRVAEGLAMEAVMTSASGVRSAKRVETLFSASEGMMRELEYDSGIARIRATVGVTSYFMGRWKLARQQLEEGLKFFRKHSSGLTMELDTAQLILAWSHFYLGELEPFLRRTAEFHRNALDRGDRLMSTCIHIGLANASYLVQDDAIGARSAIQTAMDRWVHGGFLIQDSDALLALCQIDLYDGDGTAALGRISQTWKALKRSMVLHVEVTRLEMWQLQGRAALAAAVKAQAEDKKPLLGLAEKNAARITRSKVAWAAPWAALLRAGVASLRSDKERAKTELAVASKGFDEHDMALYATVARYHLGLLTSDAPGDQGDADAAAAKQWLRERGAVNPPRLIAMLAPGL